MGIFKKRNQLSKLSLDEISLVPSGDDPTAEIVIAKAEDDLTYTEGSEAHTLITDAQGVTDMPDMPDEQHSDDLDLTGVSPEIVAYIEALEEEIERNDVVGEIIDLLGDDAEAETPEVAPEVAPEPEAVLAKAAPEVLDVIAKAEARAEAAEAIAKAERDLRIHREFVAKAESMPMLTENPEQFAEVLKALNEASPELCEVVTDIFAAANNQIAKGNLFTEFGSSAVSYPGADRADAVADDIRKANPGMTYEQALTAAYEADPSLYNESL